MKKITKFIVMILVIATMLFTVAFCNKKGEITVNENAMPQLVHVLGEELDLSAGTLIYNKGKKSEEIAMDAEGVEISGYNKDQLGEQTVTLTYEGASTTITVTVVERMQVVDFVADYLVGDALDKTKGRLRITQNNGTSYTVNLNNANVSIEGFSTGSAGAKTLTAKYETYEATFTVNVHAVDSITLQAPNKKAYSSHDQKLILDGGRIVLSGNNGALTREIKLTDESVTVSGFDPKAVNETKTTDTQSICVTYGGANYYYDIKLTYTAVSMFNDNAHKFKEFDWDGEEAPVISEELGEFALDLMSMYVELPTADAILISQEDLLNVARAAVWYGYTKWYEDITSFEGAFDYGYDESYESYSIFVTCESYEAVKKAIAGLEVEDRDLYRMYQHLVKICEIESIYDEVTALIPTSIIGDTMIAALVPMFEHMVEFYEKWLPEIPENWATNGYAAYEEQITTIYDLILEAGYIDSANSWIYEQVTYWYDSDNSIKIFDAFYEYYFAKNDKEALANLAKVTLHSSYLELITKLDELMTTLDSVDNGDVLDNTEFFRDYYAFVEYSAEFVEDGDAMTKYIYTDLPVNTLFGYDDTDEIYISTLVDYLYYGYAQITSSLIDIPAFDNLMEDYLAAYLIAEENENYLTDPDFAKYVEGMFDHYLELSATEQYLFFGAIMTNYYWRADLLLAFDPDIGEERYIASFVNFILEYYDSLFTDENAKAAYRHLLVANEIYTKKYDEMFKVDDWDVAFAKEMTAFATAYEAISDKDYFNCYFGGLTAYCNAIAGRIENPLEEIPAEWKDIFDQLKVAIKAMDDASYIIEDGSLDSEGYYFYNVFLAAYERAQKLVNIILESGDEEIIDIYYHELIYVLNVEYDDGTKETYIHSYEYAFSGLRGYYILYRIYTAGSAEAYEDFGFPEFFDLVYDLIVPYFNAVLYQNDAAIDITHEQLLAIMTAYSKLANEAKAYHLLMEGGVYSTYYNAIAKHLSTSTDYSENVDKLISTINELEYAQSFYYYYTTMADADSAAVQSEIKKSIEDIEEVYETLVKLYAELTDAEKAEFAPFQAIYDQYIAEVEAMLAQLEA